MHLRLPGFLAAIKLVTPAATALLALSALAGCKVEGELDVEPLVRYEGDASTDFTNYKAGQSLFIQSRLGDVKVVVGSSDQVETTFEPFTLDTEDHAQQAADQLDQLLVTDVTEDGGNIKVEVYRKEDASGNLGADVTVRVPAKFNGGFEAFTDLGDVEADFGGVAALTITKVTSDGPGDIVLRSAAGPLTAITDLGDIDIQILSWSESLDGVVSTGNGDVALSVPTAANGQITAFADGPDAVVNEPSPLPETWTMADGGPNAKSFTFGTGEGGLVDISTGLGDITIDAN
ncbi:MAG: hypothetical protein WKG00_07765 [Polyangiaceae bacterium]